MAGWDATGTRVELGTDESVEYRTNVSVFVFTTQERTVTVERAEWRGLTKAGAAAKAATSGWTITARELVDDSGQWHVREERKTEGSWS